MPELLLLLLQLLLLLPRTLPEGAIWGPKWVWFWHAPRAWSPWRVPYQLSVRW